MTPAEERLRANPLQWERRRLHVLQLRAMFAGIAGLTLFAIGLLSAYSAWWWLMFAPWLLLEAAATRQAARIRRMQRDEGKASD